MRAGVAVEALTLTLGAFRLKNISLAVRPNEILVILGPNGAGKSVTLETIAGFHRPQTGRVLIGDRDVTALPPERRNVGFVVQNFGLFPHLTVAQNIAIAPRRDRAAGSADFIIPTRDDPDALLGYFGVARLAERAPADLSPGEKQRVALARALAGAPDVFLFDEPFSALDAETRTKLRDELKSFLQALAIPAIFVTHDHAEAMTLADRVAVVRDGAVIQSGPTHDVFYKPANSSVARFVGMENILPARICKSANDGVLLSIGQGSLRAAVSVLARQPETVVFAGISAENVRVRSPGEGGPFGNDINRIKGRVAGLRSSAPLVAVEIDCGFPLKAYLLAPQARAMNLVIGSTVAAEIAAEAVHLMAE
jgi:ABC-type sugar transport system ATPase subunit